MKIATPKMSAQTQQGCPSPSSAAPVAELKAIIFSDSLESSEFRLSFALLAPPPAAPVVKAYDGNALTTFRSTARKKEVTNTTNDDNKSECYKGSDRSRHRRSASASEVETLLGLADFTKKIPPPSAAASPPRAEFDKRDPQEKSTTKSNEASEGSNTCDHLRNALAEAAADDSDILPAACSEPAWCFTTTDQQQHKATETMKMAQGDGATDAAAFIVRGAPGEQQPGVVQRQPIIIGRLNDIPGGKAGCENDAGVSASSGRGSPWIRPDGRRAKDSSYYFHGGNLFDPSHLLLAAMDGIDDSEDDGDFWDTPDMEGTDDDTSSSNYGYEFR